MLENPISARELVLALLDSSAERTLQVAYFLAAAALFEMDPGSVRVALARLVKDGSLQQVGRGRYALGSRGGELHTMVRNWAKLEASLKPWRGDWLGVPLGHLARSDRSRLRARERALRLLGFAADPQGLWLRPANLRHTLEQIHQRLCELGLDNTTPLLQISALVPQGQIDPAALWSREQLEAEYRRHTQALLESRRRLPGLDEGAAARETLLLGRNVTRAILLDPLLPEALVDVSLRGDMIAAMIDYDRLGRRLWREFFQRHGGQRHGGNRKDDA